MEPEYKYSDRDVDMESEPNYSDPNIVMESKHKRSNGDVDMDSENNYSDRHIDKKPRHKYSDPEIGMENRWKVPEVEQGPLIPQRPRGRWELKHVDLLDDEERRQQWGTGYERFSDNLEFL